MQGVAAKYKLERFLRYGHKLVSAVWNDETAKWHLTFDLVDEKGEKTGSKEVDVDVVIQGMGGLSRWDWPNIPGLHDFKVRHLDLFSSSVTLKLTVFSIGDQVPLSSIPGRSGRGGRQAGRRHRFRTFAQLSRLVLLQ